MRNDEEAEPLQAVTDHIRFDNVSFAYTDGPEVLSDISFGIQAGETVGIVGPSGSGKSTLVRLLSRFYEPGRGRILVDGTPLNEIDLASFRRQIAIVGQTPYLFRTSLLENIRYGAPEADHQKVIRCARVANAHEFIVSFPEAYDTDARERGTRLSGGERQRICIARAILKDPKLLILDEATSSVDTKNERLIQNALDELIKGRTTFIIAHRLSTLRNADKILMLKEGRLRDFGSHDELMDRCPDYVELVEAQHDLDGESDR